MGGNTIILQKAKSGAGATNRLWLCRRNVSFVQDASLIMSRGGSSGTFPDENMGFVL